ncbi:hypothetical protein BAY61_17675 [Prauserella marina]|nr:hypothetical protein BAY61_17675 [Prauserella marina]
MPEPGTSTATHTAIARQLTEDAATALLDPLDTLLGREGPSAEVTALRNRLSADAEMWAAQVTGADERLAEDTMSRIVSALYLHGTDFDPPAAWWASPFGRLVARRFGHPTATAVPLTVAAAMLGITRQGVHDLVNRGKLHREPGGHGVLVSSVRQRLNPA